jgi:5-formyltetrahydrofolate cyclo-ligase
MQLTKLELRQKLKQTRLEMTDAERTVKSREIVRRLKSEIDWVKVKSVHYFEPIKQLVEVDISSLITYLEDTYPDLKLFTPRLIGGNWELIAAKGGEVPSKFDVVIVPMLGFDSRLHRIGYGGGYYDKFLAGQAQAQKIGVCFDNGKTDYIPDEPHDVSLSMIITETDAYKE